MSRGTSTSQLRVRAMTRRYHARLVGARGRCERDYDPSVRPRPDLVERERRFYDAGNTSYRRWRNLIWRLLGPFNRNDEVHALYDPRGKRVLLYGCGAAYDARRMLEGGAAAVAGIDVSEVEIAKARRQLGAAGYADAV